MLLELKIVKFRLFVTAWWLTSCALWLFLLYLCSVPLAVFGYVIRSLLQYQMLLLVI